MVNPGDRPGGEPAVCTPGTLLRGDLVSSDLQAQTLQTLLTRPTISTPVSQAEWSTLIGRDCRDRALIGREL